MDAREVENTEQARQIVEACGHRHVKVGVFDKAKTMGLDVFSGFEYEFFVFNETPHSVREKNYQNMQPLTPAEFGYSVIRNSVESETCHSILKLAVNGDL